MNATTSGRSAALATVILVVMFAAGGFSGALLVRGPAPAQSTVRTDFFQVVIDSLDPSVGQRALVDSILSERTRRTNDAVEAAVLRLQAMVDSTKAELRGVLDEDQAADFDRLVDLQQNARPARRRGVPRSGG